MGAVTFTTAFMPTNAQIGGAAPILLTAIRRVQDLAFGTGSGRALRMA